MAKRAVQELSNDGDTEATIPTATTTTAAVDAHITSDEALTGNAPPLTAITTVDDGCSAAARSGGRTRTGSSTPSKPAVAVAAAVAPPGGGRRPNSRCSTTSEPEGLEVLQLVAKGQALSSAVVVVEGVLHKMEEQARFGFARL